MSPPKIPMCQAENNELQMNCNLLLFNRKRSILKTGRCSNNCEYVKLYLYLRSLGPDPAHPNLIDVPDPSNINIISLYVLKKPN